VISVPPEWWLERKGKEEIVTDAILEELTEYDFVSGHGPDYHLR
jgi:hypothetical protein